MKHWIAAAIFGTLLPMHTAWAADSAQSTTPCPAILKHTFPKLQDDSPQNLCQYSGKVVLVVNTASYCGFTYQYQGLEALYQKNKDRGLVILGFPSNDFFQEKSNNKDIADFCYNTYGVVFPMFAKSSVRGSDANALFKALAKATGKSPSWNFNKYLIDRSGRVLAHFGSTTEATDPKLLGQINSALGHP